MDKKYIAEKRNKSKQYKNSKYNKNDVIKKTAGAGDKHKPQQTDEDVPNNWSRYEIKNDDEICVSNGADYETLLLAPVSLDSHFKFKSEQNWDEDINSQVNLSKYFTLNIDLLNKGISCIPFIKRHNYDDSIISTSELEKMYSTSESNLKKYNKLLDEKFSSKNDVSTKNCDIIEPQNKKIEMVPEVKRINSESSVVEDNVDDLLNLKYSHLEINDDFDIKAEDPLLETTVINKIITPQPTVDLEQWLDDILDD